MTELTGMEICNASLLDEASATGEAMRMVYRIVMGTDKRKSVATQNNLPSSPVLIVSPSVHPHIIKLLIGWGEYQGIEIAISDPKKDENLDACSKLLGKAKCM